MLGENWYSSMRFLWPNDRETPAFAAGIGTTAGRDRLETGTLRGPGVATPRVQNARISLSPGQWFTQEVVVSGQDIRVFVDGKLVSRHQAALLPKAGHLGIALSGGGVIRIRKIEVLEQDSAGQTIVGAGSDNERTSAQKEFQLSGRGDFRGWVGRDGSGVADPASIFRIERDELVWSGKDGSIQLEKLDGNFSWKFDYLVATNGRKDHADFLLKLDKLGGPTVYRTVPDRVPVREIKCPLVASNDTKVGDLETEEVSASSQSHIIMRKADAEQPAGGWNEAEIVCDGQVIRFFLNGREVNGLALDHYVICYPGFQSSGTDIRLRNVRLVQLDQSKSTAGRRFGK